MQRLSMKLILIGLLNLVTAGCETSKTGQGIADSCYQPLYWPSKACPPGKK